MWSIFAGQVMSARMLVFLARRVHANRRNLSQVSKTLNYAVISTRTLHTHSHLNQTQRDNSQGQSSASQVQRSAPDGQSTDASLNANREGADQKEETQQYIGIFKRFKDAYKEHGKVLVGVHLVTSAMWTGVFYYAASSGIDVTPLLIKLGASDKVVQYLSSSVGNLATTYVMYKIATPARYTVTIFGTYTTVRYLRKWGYIAPPAKEDRLRQLVKEKYVDMKDDVKEKYVDMKDDVKDKYGDMKGDMKQKLKSKVGIKKKES